MRSTPLVALFALALLPGCQSGSEMMADPAASAAPAPVVEEVQEVVATVEAIELTQRQVTLLTPDGERLPLVVGPEVRNLPQVEVGDQVLVRYREAIAAELKEPGAPSRVGEMTESATTAPAGTKPGAEVARRITTTVEIQNVDPAGPTVSFTGPNGVLRMVDVQDPGMQAFARTLKPGDEVDITYTEALALSVEPASQ
jgi:translation elongation factor P/translation initiation factor 5A